MRFDGKYAIVTGAAQGIGRAIAQRLCDEGATVALIDLQQAQMVENVRMRTYACDIADKQQVEDVFGEIARQFGRVDVLVNNAGITRDAMFHKMSDEQWEDVIRVNLGGMYHCCKAVVPGMRERRYGRIVNLASVSAFGNIGQVNYGASKAGVIGFTKCLAREMARYGCTVNCIAPSYINTDMLRAVPENVMNKFINAIPLGRLGEPEELAAVAAFLASDDASFVSGECLVVSGGSYM